MDEKMQCVKMKKKKRLYIITDTQQIHVAVFYIWLERIKVAITYASKIITSLSVTFQKQGRVNCVSRLL